MRIVLKVLDTNYEPHDLAFFFNQPVALRNHTHCTSSEVINKLKWQPKVGFAPYDPLNKMTGTTRPLGELVKYLAQFTNAKTKTNPAIAKPQPHSKPAILNPKTEAA